MPNPNPNPIPNPNPNLNPNPNPNPSYAGPSLWQTFAMAGRYPVPAIVSGILVAIAPGVPPEEPKMWFS